MAEVLYTEDYIQHKLPEGFKVSTNIFTGVMTVTAPDNTKFQINNKYNITNQPTDATVYTVDKDHTTEIVYDTPLDKQQGTNGRPVEVQTYNYTFSENGYTKNGKTYNGVNDLLSWVNSKSKPSNSENSTGPNYDIHTQNYTTEDGKPIDTKDPTQAMHINTITGYLNANGVNVKSVTPWADGSNYRIIYVGSDGKEYPYDVPVPFTEGSDYTQAEKNNHFGRLIAEHGNSNSNSNPGTSTGSSTSGTGGTYSNPEYEEAKRKAEEEAEAARKTAINNSNTSDALIKDILGSPELAGATSAKQDFTISKADYEALRAQYPNYSDEQLTNMIANSDWAKTFGETLDTDPTKSAFKGATLKEFLATAGDSNKAAKTIADISIDQPSSAVLKEIANDPALYEALVKQHRADAVANTIAGQRVANALAAARENNATYKASADELYKLIGGTGDESVAGKLRSATYNNNVGAYNAYVDQQLNKLSRDMNAQTTDVADLVTALSLINQGLIAEDAQVKRDAADESNRIANEANDRTSEATQKSQASITNANTSADVATNKASIATQVANSDLSLNKEDVSKATSNKHTNYGTGTYNKPQYEDAPYIDENLYETLLGTDYTKYLDDDTVARFINATSEAELAKQYGLGDLTDINKVVDRYKGYQTQANKASDKALNAAQRAYLAAIAAGDAKTAEQLTRLAQAASTSRKNLYGATALANQFAQQRDNAGVSNALYYDQQQQQAVNASSIANAIQTGRQQRNSWYYGDGSKGASDNSFGTSYNTHLGNVSDAKAAYGDLIGGAIGNQTSYNDTVGQLNRDSNTTLSGYAADLNKLNTAGANTNTTNSGTVAGIKNTLGVQGLINDATRKKNAKK